MKPESSTGCPRFLAVNSIHLRQRNDAAAAIGDDRHALAINLNELGIHVKALPLFGGRLLNRFRIDAGLECAPIHVCI